MLYTFKSSSAADVIMQRFSAEKMLSVLGKTPGKTGVITVSEMDDLIQKIESELSRQVEVERGAGNTGAEISNQHDAVRFRESADTFLQLLRTSKASGSNVVWGL
jgi:cyclopropane-fatty-acyl-phospholipid synthase